MTDDWNITEAALELTCPRCKAGPGERCETATGNSAALHASRWRPLSLAFGEGYSEGRSDAEGIAARRAARGSRADA